METSSTHRSERAAALARRGRRILPIILVAFVVGFLLRGCFAPTPENKRTGRASEAAAPVVEVWTCSMHPQIRSPKPGLCPICAMDLIPVGAEDDAGGARVFSTSAEAAALMNIQTVPAVRQFVDASVRMVGKVEYDETRFAHITAWVPGRIEKLYVDYTGVRVNKGDHMADLYSPQLISAQEELRQAKRTAQTIGSASSSARQTALATLEASRERLRLWGLTPEQIQQAEEGGAAPDRITIYAPVGGTVIAREGTEGQYVETGMRIYTLADLSQMWVMLDAYESDLQWLRYGQKVEFTTEAYPGQGFEGTIAFIDPFLNPQTRTAKVRVNVPNPDARLKPEMFVRGVVHSQVAEGGRVMDPDLADKWMCPMHPEVVRDGPDNCPICGMDLVQATDLGYIPVDELDKSAPLIIPASAPLVTGKRAVVYVRIPGAEKPTFEGREIVLGPRAGDYYIVRSGLEEGEEVVVNGNFKIDSALQIMAKPSMMTPQGGGAPTDHAHHAAHAPGDAPQQAAGDTPRVQLPRGAREALRGVIEAREAVAQARTVQARREALESLVQELDAVDLKALPGEVHTAWVEYQRRLKNDAVEAQFADKEAERTRVLALLRDDMNAFTRHFGLEGDGVGELVVAEAFQEQLRDLYDAYLAMQDALAGDDPEKSRAAAGKVEQALVAVDMGVLSHEAHEAWMPFATNMKQAIEESRGAADIKAMRSAFLDLSTQLIQAVDTFGIADGAPVYQIHCSMAFGGEGGDWLQATTDVRNPYYGASMLACGDVRGRLDGE